METRQERLLYTRSARARLQALPAEVRLHVETHMANLALLVEGLAPEHLPQILAHEDEGFVTAVPGARVRFVVAPAARALLVYRIETLPEREVAAPVHPLFGHE